MRKKILAPAVWALLFALCYFCPNVNGASLRPGGYVTVADLDQNFYLLGVCIYQIKDVHSF